MVLFVFLDVVFGQWLAGQLHVRVAIDVVRHEREGLATVQEPARPVQATLLRVRLIRMVKVQVRALRHHNLGNNMSKLYLNHTALS